MPRKRKDDGAPPVNLRRMYVDCRYGQLHLRSAFPSNGGFDELTTLVCLSPGSTSSRVFGGFLALMGSDRSVYAPDMPGCGESDGPAEQVSIGEHTGAIGDFLDHMRFRQVDLLAYQGGASLAASLAAARPQQVRRVILVEPKDLAAGAESPGVEQPVLVLRPKEGPAGVAPRLKDLLPNARFAELAGPALDLFQMAPEVVARLARAFLD